MVRGVITPLADDTAVVWRSWISRRETKYYDDSVISFLRTRKASPFRLATSSTMRPRRRRI